MDSCHTELVGMPTVTSVRYRFDHLPQKSITTDIIDSRLKEQDMDYFSCERSLQLATCNHGGLPPPS